MTNTRTLAKEAAFKLLQRGERPTADKVRAAIGRGAQQTILAALDEFWQETGARLSEPRLPEPLLEPVMALWSQAVSLATQHWQNERAGFEERIQTLGQSVQTLTLERDEERTARLSEQTRAERADRLVVQLQQQLAEQLEIGRTLRAETDRLVSESSQLKDSLQTEREARERDQAAWLQQIDAGRQAIKGIQAERDQLAKQLDEARETRVRQGILLSQTQQQVAGLETEVERLVRERDESRALVMTLARDLEQRDSELQHGAQLLESRDAQLRECETRLQASGDSLAALRLEREALAAENRVLREELGAQHARRDDLEKSLQLVLAHWQEQ